MRSNLVRYPIVLTMVCTIFGFNPCQSLAEGTSGTGKSGNVVTNPLAGIRDGDRVVVRGPGGGNLSLTARTNSGGGIYYVDSTGNEYRADSQGNPILDQRGTGGRLGRGVDVDDLGKRRGNEIEDARFEDAFWGDANYEIREREKAIKICLQEAQTNRTSTKDCKRQQENLDKIKASKNMRTDPEFDRCKAAYKKADRVCRGGDFAAQIQGAIQQIQAMQSQGNIAAMCGGAKKLNIIVGSANAAIGTLCLTARQSCLTMCNPTKMGFNNKSSDFASIRESCSDLREAIEGLYAQAGVNMMQSAMAARCEKDAKQAENIQNEMMRCYQPKAVDDPKCPEMYCRNASRKKEEVCKDFYTEFCQGPQAAELLACVCKANPRDSRCSPQNISQYPPRGVGPGSGGGGGGGGGPGSQFDGDTDFKDPYAGAGGDPMDIPGEKPDLQPLENKQPNGTAGIGQGGGLSGFGAPNQGGGGAGGAAGQAGGAPGVDTNIIEGTTGGGAGEQAMGAGGLGEESGSGGGGSVGGSRGNPEDDKINGFDLRAFLPGGAKDPTRVPASADAILLQNGISAANGLSNFEKVSRRYRELQNTLLPP